MVFISGTFCACPCDAVPPSHALICTRLGDPPPPGPTCVLNVCPLKSVSIKFFHIFKGPYYLSFGIVYHKGDGMNKKDNM